jgi:hypothetical protein
MQIYVPKQNDLEPVTWEEADLLIPGLHFCYAQANKLKIRNDQDPDGLLGLDSEGNLWRLFYGDDSLLLGGEWLYLPVEKFWVQPTSKELGRGTYSNNELGRGRYIEIPENSLGQPCWNGFHTVGHVL